MYRRPDRLVALVLLSVLCATAFAQGENPGTREEIIIRSDRAVLDRTAGTGVYTGNAEMVQGQRRLRAERIELRMENGELREAEAYGDPVRIREGDELNGHAQRVVYKVAEDEVHLYDKAFLFHKGRTFEGARLRYQLESRRVEASGSDRERVKMVIPQEDTPGGDKDKP
jgi:lipopolysaccharide export system protein LptA